MWFEGKLDDRAIGPIGLHDAYLLDAICRYVRPKVILEYGGLLGVSLSVMAPHCQRIVSVDDNAGEELYEVAKKAGNARVVKAKMEEYEPAEDGLSSVDLVFFDAAHKYAEDIAAYIRVNPVLSERAVLLVHDTGDWPAPEAMPDNWREWSPHREMFCQNDRKFVAFLRGQGWNDVTFDGGGELRHGITVLTRPRW